MYEVGISYPCYFFLVYDIAILFFREGKTILSVPNDILADTSAYIKLYAVGFMFYSLTMLIISMQRGKGDLKQPTIELLLLYLLNILMDLLFVRILNLGLTGVSLSFITTYFLSTVYLMIYLHKHYHVLSNKVSVDMSEVKIILYIGIPTSLASMFYDVANTYTQTAIRKLFLRSNAIYVNGSSHLTGK